jgi:asparagine synthase (glutamine-hydrolysing)
MTQIEPALDGFLVSLPADMATPFRGWPRQERAGQSAVWFDGYLANPASLRGELKLDGTTSFAQIVEAAWRRWGADITERVFGEYAAVIVTGPDAVMLGDRMGLRPFYYASGPYGTVVSTDLGILARETRAWRELDEDYLADIFSSGLHLGPRTPYRSIKRLEVGQFATWQSGRLQVRGGLRLSEEPVVATFEEHQELLRATVRQAVADTLSSDGALAVELSGGLDTSTVLAVAVGLSPVHALSFVHPGDPGSDETSWIREALKTTPATWHPINATEHGIFTAGPELGTFLPTPSRRILNWAPNAAEDALAMELGVSTLLTGEGGDAVFFAGLLPWYLADLLRAGRWRQLRQEVLRWSAHTEVRRSSMFWMRRAAVGGLRGWRRGRTLALEPPRAPGVSAPWLNQAYVDSQQLADRTQMTTAIRARSVHGQAVLENVLRCAEFARSRRVFPSGAVDVRHPLLASSLIDLAMNTPWRIAVDPRVDRAVQRYAFSGTVSETVLRRRSKTIADEAILRGFERHPRWREYLCEDPHVVQRGYVDAQRWSSALSAVGRIGGVTQLYAAIQIEVWLRHLRHVGVPTLLL